MAALLKMAMAPMMAMGVPLQNRQKKAKKKPKKMKKNTEQNDDDVNDVDGVGNEEAITDGGYANGDDKNTSSGGEGGTAAKAFQRVKADEWLGKKGSWDNSYVGTFGAEGWGFKAQQILGQVKGKDFRHEKTKKKRGSYRGGLIDPDARLSYKFESDDE